MKTRKNLIIVAMIMGSLLPFFASESFGVEEKKEFDAQTREKMEKFLDKALEESRSPGALVGVWAPGKGNWVTARGTANLETGQPARTDDKTRIGSITKTFVATVVLQLVDGDKIDLDDPIEKYLAFVPVNSGITVRQLLNHSSGIFDIENDDPDFRKAVDENPAKAISPQKIVELSMSHEPYNKPGEGGHYSNANYKALGLIVEKVTGKDLGTVIQERIFDKLGLEKTVFATKPEIEGEHIHGYALLPEQTFDMTVRPDIWELWASGNIVSTLEDQKKWAEAIGQGKLLSQKTYKEMTNWIEIEAALPGKFKYGLGVDLVGEGFIGHAGGVDGYYGRIAHNPDTDTTIVVFFNNVSAREDILVYEGFLHELIDLLQPLAPAEHVTPVLASFVAPPRPALVSDGRAYLLYEIILANASNVPFTIEKLKVVDAHGEESQIALFDRGYIEAHSRFPGTGSPGALLGPGQSGFVRINLSFQTLDDVPESISHVLTVSSEEPWGPYETTVIIEPGALADIPRETGPVIGPPLKGDRWIACDVGGEGPHRTTVMPLNGKWVTPERWGVDWVRIDENNRLITGDPLKLGSYPQYGQEVIAVADGTVLRIKDDLPDEVPGKMPEGITIHTAGGNFVFQNIGDGYSAFYAHLIPGSVRVKAGDKVKRGQVLGLLGNSGNTDAPHLHFHVVKGMSFLTSDGVPYVIDSFVLRGQTVSNEYLMSRIESGEPVEVRPVDAPGKRTREMPADMAVVEFSQ